MLRDIERASNPWGGPVRARRMGGFAGRARARARRSGARGPVLGGVRVARLTSARARRRESTAILLQRAGVDFAILGPREACTGDPARRMGNEYVFQAFAEQNVATLNEPGEKIMANCPHCFNTLANEYPDFGGDYEVVHHTELLAELVRTGVCRPRAGRAGDHLPRLLLSGPPQRRAMAPPASSLPRSGSRWRWPAAASAPSAAAPAAPTCGWRSAAARSTKNRVREAVATGAQTLAVACPFCTVMLDDGMQSAGAEMRVADVATLLVEAIAPRAASPAGGPGSRPPRPGPSRRRRRGAAPRARARAACPPRARPAAARPVRGALGGPAGGRGRVLGQPQHTRVVAEVSSRSSG